MEISCKIHLDYLGIFVSSSPFRAGHVKPKTFNIGSDCSFAKNPVLRSENHGVFGHDFKEGGPVSQ
jgi:hypothetical protein